MTPRDALKFLRWIWRGKSARRAFLNMEVDKALALGGTILDIGGKGQPSYQDVLRNRDEKKWVVMDIAPGRGTSVLGDIVSLPFRGESFDAAICFNVLEHVYDYRSALSEVSRVLKRKAVLYGYVPFICSVHPDPFDYWRFTADSLNNILRESGISPLSVRPHGGVFISCFDLVSFAVKKMTPLRTMLAVLLLSADSLLKRIRPGYAERFPVGYFFVAQKPE